MDGVYYTGEQWDQYDESLERDDDVVYYIGEQWDQHDERLEREDDEEQGNDDEELQPLMDKELEALATVSQANRTLIQARQAVKDARATRQPLPRRSAAASARESERRCFCVEILIWLVIGQTETSHLARVRRGPETRRQARKTGKDTGFGAVTMATAFTVLDERERKFVICAEETRQINMLGDDYYPFEVYSTPRQLCPKRTSLSDWNHWRHHLIEVRLSVLHGNVLESLQKV